MKKIIKLGFDKYFYWFIAYTSQNKKEEKV